MQITAFLAIVSVALIPSASAGCFSGGEAWDNKTPAFDAARNFCNNGGLNGNYVQTETKRRCANGNGKKFDFTIRNVSGGARSLGPAECYDGLQKEINGCNFGGSTRYTNWEYT